MISEEQLPQSPVPDDVPTQGDGAPRPPFLERREGRILLYAAIGSFTIFVLVFGICYLRFARIIDTRLSRGPFADTFNIYTAPRTVAVGDAATAEDIVARLESSGFTTSRGNTVGWYHVRPHAVEVFPGRDSYAGVEPGVLEFSGGKISRIVSLLDNTERKSFVLEPQLIANYSGQREKRRLVQFSEIPPALVHAVVSTEDKHFFRHSGFDAFRILKAAYVDAREGRKEQGASTLTMQLARGIWLDPDKNWKRKLEELLITMHLEHKLTKQQIFEDYANQVYLGRHGTFSIHGFGEGSRLYFNKELPQLTIPEAALLAGLVQRPSYYNPFRYPDRARERRNLVLLLMRQNNYLTPEQYRSAIAAPIAVSPGKSSEGAQTQYFVDLMTEELQSKIDEHRQPHYLYTTLDPDLQEAAQQAVAYGMPLVDQQLRRGKKHPTVNPDQPQVALIAIDPHTGEIKALVGGRDYRNSQLNHVLAMRQPGSVFKPFVYAAALETALSGGPHIFTPDSTVVDEPTTFTFEGHPYQPSNFHNDYMGLVTLRTALAHSLNVATVEVAQEVGYGRVAAVARRAGLNEAIHATPAMALGAYETTPLEIAGAYTLFANQGRYVAPTTISLVRGAGGAVLYQHDVHTRPALDPRVSYLMVNMLQDVLRYGTAAGVRARGFTQPAAGKTGTSRDGWFAGFTSELLCVVWVGFDDNRELNLEGAKSALPIWTEFMKRASRFRRYQNAANFEAPPGVVTVRTCSDSGELAGPFCPNVRADVFINGTQPTVECRIHGNPSMEYSERVEEPPSPPPHAANIPAATSPQTVPSAAQPVTATAPRTIPAATAPRTVPAAADTRVPSASQTPSAASSARKQ
jgi:penicillin-binding protein 1B